MTDNHKDDAVDLLNAARNYIKVYARIMCPLVSQEKINSIVAATGEISISSSCLSLDIMQQQAENKK